MSVPAQLPLARTSKDVCNLKSLWGVLTNQEQLNYKSRLWFLGSDISMKKLYFAKSPLCDLWIWRSLWVCEEWELHNRDTRDQTLFRFQPLCDVSQLDFMTFDYYFANLPTCYKIRCLSQWWQSSQELGGLQDGNISVTYNISYMIYVIYMTTLKSKRNTKNNRFYFQRHIFLIIRTSRFGG